MKKWNYKLKKFYIEQTKLFVIVTNNLTWKNQNISWKGIDLNDLWKEMKNLNLDELKNIIIESISYIWLFSETFWEYLKQKIVEFSFNKITKDKHTELFDYLTKHYFNKISLIWWYLGKLYWLTRHTIDIDFLTILTNDQIIDFANELKNKFDAHISITKIDDFDYQEPLGSILNVYIKNYPPLQFIQAKTIYQKDAVKFSKIEKNKYISYNKVLSIEYYILLKLCANSERDLEDIKGILSVNKNIDNKTLFELIDKYKSLINKQQYNYLIEMLWKK